MNRTNLDEEDVFEAARKFTDPGELKAFLDGACRGSQDLRRHVEHLLAVATKADDFFQHNAPPPVGKSLAADRQSTVLTPVAEKPGMSIGRYKLREKIGEGGCGVVYVAEQEEPVRRRVALKVIKLGMDTRQVVARFEAERQALAMMDHPNIAKVLDAGATGTGRPYFVMELVRGIKITDYCDQNQLSTSQRLELFIQVCHAVQHAHQKGIIHRDLKPSNILVTLHDGEPVPKVIDFGIAKATEGRLTNLTVYTELHQFIGTPAYMSPEQAEMSGLDIDTRSDIYALGVLLYELLTGRTPFDPTELLAAGLDEIRRTIREVEPARPSTRLSTLENADLTTVARARGSEAPKLVHLVRGDLDWIVMKCLEKNRGRRYETASGLAIDLKRHLNNEPVTARPPSNLYRLHKLVRRNKLTFTAATAVALALIVGIVASTWQTGQARSAQRSEAQQRKLAEQYLYAADLNLIQQKWEQQNVIGVRELLTETANFPGRGFEWDYWQRQAYAESKTLAPHRGPVLSVAFSPDGRRLLTACSDREYTAQVWEAQTGAELLVLKGHQSRVLCAVFSPDGRRILTGSSDRTARVWDAATGQAVFPPFEGHKQAVNSVAFSPDGQRLVTASSDHTAIIWDANNGRQIGSLNGHTNGVKCTVWSPDGARILTGSADRTAKLWDATSGKCLATFRHGAAVNAVAFSPDSRRVVSAGGDQAGPDISQLGPKAVKDTTARVWDAESGNELLVLDGHRFPINAVAFSPDRRWILTASSDHTAKLWDAVTGADLLTLEGHSSAIVSVAFSKDGRWIATGGADARARIWPAQGEKKQLIVAAHTNAVTSVAFSPDGRRMATGAADHSAKNLPFRNIETNSDDPSARVWDALTGQSLYSLEGHSGGIMALAYSPDGRRIVTASSDHLAMVWDAADGHPLFTLRGHADVVIAVAYSADGQRILTGSADASARLWETANGREVLRILAHSNPVLGVAFSPDCRQFATASFDRTAKLWDATDGHLVRSFVGHNQPLPCVAFSPDGLRLVTGSDDKTAVVWNLADGSVLLTLRGHAGAVRSVAFSPDGRRILTGSGDGTTKLWDAIIGKELLTLKGHSAPVHSVAFSSDGQRIITGSADHTVRVWEAARSQVSARLEDKIF